MKLERVFLVAAITIAGCAARGTNAASPPPAAAPPPPPPSPSAGAEPMLTTELQRAADVFVEANATFDAASSDCAQMCKALASMERAADNLCALTADGTDNDKKACDAARSKVADAESKVKSTCGPTCP